MINAKERLSVEVGTSCNIDVDINTGEKIEFSIDKMTFYNGRSDVPKHTHDASEISYFTAGDESISNVKNALDKLLYVPLTIDLTSNIQTTLEMGTTVNSVVFNWNYNKDIASQKFNNQALEASLRTYAHNLSFNSNKSFKLEANDWKGDFSKSISFNFLNGRYWGVSNSKMTVSLSVW